MDYPDRAECEFMPPPLNVVRHVRMTQCADCPQTIPLALAVVKTFYRNHHQVQEHFCCIECRDRWYIRQLNTAGM